MCRFRVACRAAARLHQSTRLLVCLDVFCAAALLKMTEKRQFRAIKGTRDILPPDSALWNWFEQAAREVFEAYNFREIRLPIFEETELFARSIGADTDVVSKEMFTFRLPDGSERLAQEDAGISQAGDPVSLRPEATASTMRAY